MRADRLAAEEADPLPGALTKCEPTPMHGPKVHCRKGPETSGYYLWGFWTLVALPSGCEGGPTGGEERRPWATTLSALPAHITAAQYSYNQMQATFGFCTDDFRPEWLWFEPVDLIRKLTLTGLLQFVWRGTVAQAFCGCIAATRLARYLPT